MLLSSNRPILIAYTVAALRFTEILRQALSR